MFVLKIMAQRVDQVDPGYQQTYEGERPTHCSEVYSWEPLIPAVCETFLIIDCHFSWKLGITTLNSGKEQLRRTALIEL